jgi:hypothetical protein
MVTIYVAIAPTRGGVGQETVHAIDVDADWLGVRSDWEICALTNASFAPFHHRGYRNNPIRGLSEPTLEALTQWVGVEAERLQSDFERAVVHLHRDVVRWLDRTANIQAAAERMDTPPFREPVVRFEESELRRREPELFKRARARLTEIEAATASRAI